MKRSLSATVLALTLLTTTSFLMAQEAAPAEQSFDPAKFDASLKYQTGDVVLEGGLATLRLSPAFRYLDSDNTRRLLEQGWGNPDGSGTLGMIVPASDSPMSENGWGVIITYEEDGYVSDKDADTINYDDLLKDMQESTRSESAEREKSGFGTIELVGWAEKPSYDKANHKMYWAKDLRFDGSEQHTLNYNIRVLGRRGVLVLNAVAGMNQLDAIKNDMQDVLAFTEFNPGHTYGEFDASTDKVASYGLAALVAGGIAAKTGLFAKLIAMVVAAKKLIIFAIAGIAAFIGKLFKRDKTA